MSQDNQMSSLERDIEETRERLATTIDQLLHRANPKTIASREVSSMKARFVDPASGQPRTENILMTVGGVAGVIALLVLLRKVVN